MKLTQNNLNNKCSIDMDSRSKEEYSFPDLLTEEELIIFLRIPENSKANDYHNVVENLKRIHDLPRIHICGKVLYPLKAIKDWVMERASNGK